MPSLRPGADQHHPTTGFERLSDLVSGLAARAPERPLFTFLYSNRDAQTICAGQLHRDAQAVAATLHVEGVRPGDIVPLVFDHGHTLLAAFWGAIYLDAVPTILPYVFRGARSQGYLAQVGRLVQFAKSSRVVCAAELTDYLRDGVADAGGRIVALPSCPGADTELADSWPSRTATDPPYIQFSSGTTGLPKGVLLSHAALLRYCELGANHWAFTEADVTVGWLPLYHDMGLLTQVFEPLYTARHSVLMSPADWLREPHLLLQAVHRFRGTVTWMPNFAFRYCARRIQDAQIEGIDLSNWRLVGNASEPVLREDLEVFSERFAAYGLRRGALKVSYGMAEHVAGITWTAADLPPDVDWVRADALQEGAALPAEAGAPNALPVVSCGHPAEGVALRIVDDAGQALAERMVGELMVSSPLVFAGYHLLPDESAAALVDGWLRTGDLGYLVGGQLYICGRKKDLIIVGGRNIHPSQLERTAAEVLGEDGRFTAAFGVPSPRHGTEMPILVCELQQPPDAVTGRRLQQAVREAIRGTFELFVGEVALVDKGWIVKTTSGKINRAACRAKYLAEQSRRAEPVRAASPPPGTTEQRLAGIWRTLLDRDEIGPDDDFFDLGGDSLLAAQLTLEIEEQFQCRLPATALIDAPTFGALARLLERPFTAIEQPLLVPLQAPGTNAAPVVFLVHGLGGGVLDYLPLARALGPAHACVGVQALGMNQAAPPDERIEEMATRYVQAITDLQPNGPYQLGGYCFGGVVAYEMARQLAAAGAHVALVAILEGYAPQNDQQENRLWREWRFAINFLRALPYWLRDYLQLGRIGMRERNRRLARVVRKRLLRMIGFEVELDARDMFDELPSRPAQLQRLLETNLAAARRYAPTPYDGRVVLFRTAHRVLQAPERDMGWGRLTRQPVAVEMVAGSHGTMLEEPHVQVLADKLRDHLSAATAFDPGRRGAAPPSDAAMGARD